jgi:hypothetical protein
MSIADLYLAATGKASEEYLFGQTVADFFHDEPPERARSKGRFIPFIGQPATG